MLLKKWLTYVFAPLFLGALAYWLFRGESPPLFLRWFHVPPPPFDLSPFFPVLIIGSFPSFCWSFSMYMALFLIWKPKSKIAHAAVGSVAFGVSVLYELFQSFGMSSNSFDWGDVGASGIAILIANYISEKHFSWNHFRKYYYLLLLSCFLFSLLWQPRKTFQLSL